MAFFAVGVFPTSSFRWLFEMLMGAEFVLHAASLQERLVAVQHRPDMLLAVDPHA